jgi:hypothetical protein
VITTGRNGGPEAIFGYGIDDHVDWHAALGGDLFTRAERGAFVTAVAAGRWTESAAYAVVAPVAALGTTAIVCGLRRDLPFDAVDAASATAAARLVEMSALDWRANAEALRQSATLAERLEVLSGVGEELARTRDSSALLAHVTQEVARRMRAGAASIMLVEGDELRLRAAVGLPQQLSGRAQRIGEGIAGWVAASGTKVVLRGRVDDERFSGVDPEAGEAIVVPLREE